MRTITLFSVLIVAGALSGPRAHAQWQWPDSTENLQVLPAHWTGERLSPVMRGFTSALGVRCQYCHATGGETRLEDMDFVSDANPNKKRAREMLRMLGSINDHLGNIEPSGDRRVNMWCHTCHRGRPRPMTLAEELGEKYRSEGIASAMSHYDDLRDGFLTAGAYDFGEDALNAFGYELIGDEAFGDAIVVLTRNAELFPESANVWDSLGEAYLESGDEDQARVHYEKSLSLNPRNQNARQVLERLGDGG
jgi:tetratricopeptide (TPR) repeat protein